MKKKKRGGGDGREQSHIVLFVGDKFYKSVSFVFDHLL